MPRERVPWAHASSSGMSTKLGLLSLCWCLQAGGSCCSSCMAGCVFCSGCGWRERFAVLLSFTELREALFELSLAWMPQCFI